MLAHRREGARDNAQLSPFPTRMYEADHATNRIREVNCATIRDIYSEAQIDLVRDQAIGAVEATIAIERLVDYGDKITMDLLRRGEGVLREAELTANRKVRAVESTEYFAFVVIDLHARDSPDESMPADCGRGQRLKLFDRRKQIGQTSNALATWRYPASAPSEPFLVSGSTVAMASAWDRE